MHWSIALCWEFLSVEWPEIVLIAETGKISKDAFIRYMKCPPVSRTTLTELEQLFREYDTDGDGSITFGRLQHLSIRPTLDAEETS